MAATTEGSATDNTQVEIEWTALTTDAEKGGNTAITSYGVQWDQGTGTYVELIGESSAYTGLSYIVTTSITEGTTYEFKIRAKNKWGWGDYSSTFSILAATVPDQVATVTTSIETTTEGVQVTWVAPSDNGAAITAYLVEFSDLETTEVWSTELTHCDGSNSTVITDLGCLVSMNLLTAAPTSLVLDELVTVRVSAINSKGTGATSDENTVGALTQTVPTLVTDLAAGTDTSESQIQVDWSALTGDDTGNSAIISYQLLWDNGAAITPAIELTDSLVYTYTVTGVIAG